MGHAGPVHHPQRHICGRNEKRRLDQKNRTEGRGIPAKTHTHHTDKGRPHPTATAGRQNQYQPHANQAKGNVPKTTAEGKSLGELFW